ncbi:hypothetical protein JCM9279_000287 [Rhodotorula babjevae]
MASCLATPLRFLPLSRAELNLKSCLPSGQSFRWHRLSPATATLPDSPTPTPAPLEHTEEWAFAWEDRTVVLRQDDDGLHYRSLYPYKPPHAAFLADLERDTSLPFLRRYFNLDTALSPLYTDWSARDAKFKRKVELGGSYLEGIRVLKQDEWETLVSFICSANNNISRITLMVNRLCASLGSPLPHPSAFDPASVHLSASTIPSTAPPPPAPAPDGSPAPSLFSFPPPEALTAPTTEALLRALGFGYRAAFIPSSAAHLVAASTAAGQTPHEYLRALNRETFVKEGRGGIADAREKLVEFKGVGRKVADCVLLFGLGWTETVPVDTHVFQIAIRDYGFPSTRTTALTPLLHDRVSTLLAERWGAHAGWAQQVLFFADLKSSPVKVKVKSEHHRGVYERLEVELVEEEGGALGPDGTPLVKEERKLTFDEEVAALIATPGTKRRRTTVLQASVTKGGAVAVVKDEEDIETLSGSDLTSQEEDEEERSPSKSRARAKRPQAVRRKSSTRGGRGAVKKEDEA